MTDTLLLWRGSWFPDIIRLPVCFLWGDGPACTNDKGAFPVTDRSGITIDEVKIRRVNNESLGTVGFLCAPEHGSNLPSVDAIDAAIADIRFPGYPDQRFHAVRVSKGAAIYAHPVMGTKIAATFAAEIADAIAPLGFTGTITACTDRLGPRPKGRSSYSAAICSVETALDNDEPPLLFRTVKKNLDRWAVGNPTFIEIVDRLAAWAADNATGPVLAGIYFTMSECEPHQVAEVLTRCCEDVGWADLRFPTADGDRAIGFSKEGWILAHTEIKKDRDDTGQSLMNLLTDLAPLYDYAQMTRTGFGSPSPMSVMIQRGVPIPGDRELQTSHSLVKTSIPGIFAVQVLGPGVSDLKPADRWRITPLQAGRRMFTIDKLSDWWAAPEGPSWMRPTSEPPTDDLRFLRETNRAILFKSARP